MKKKALGFLSILLILSTVLTACAGNSTPTEAPVEPTQVVETPPVDQKPKVAAPAEVLDLDTAYISFLGEMEAYNTIKLDALAEELLEEPPLFLLDVRTAGELEDNGHIPGAVHVPLAELGQNLSVLPSFDTPIVAYCGSGWRATIAMTYLSAAGWTDVRALKANFSDWVDAGYAVEPGLAADALVLDVAQPAPAFWAAIDETLSAREGWGVVKAEDLNLALADNPDLSLIDVRKQSELDEKGVIEAANWVHVPIETFVAEMSDWPADKDAPITVYCGSGHRSTIAMAILWTYGYTDVTSLKDGFGGWVDAGYPVLGGEADLDTGYTTFLDNMVSYNTIKMDDLAVELLEEPPLFLLDVRTAGELEENGHIPDAVHMPLNELGQNLSLLPSFDTPIVVYCGSGWRATIAMTYLSAAGWTDVRALKANFSDWVDAGYAVDPGLPAEALVLDVAQPDAGFWTVVDDTLSAREGWGVIKAEDLNLALVDNPDLFLIDVRKPSELDEKGVIEATNWVHVPIETFVTGMADWPADKDETITVYCGSGHRSTIAMAILWSYGYTNVTSLKDGFGGWVDAGFPVAEAVAN
jgi:rhodanese-related sulfurtransferase